MVKIPKCPNCKNEMVMVWYDEPNEFIEQFVEEKKIFYRGLELKDEDINNPDRITYHCYNCSRSYSKNLKNFVEEKEVLYPYEEIDKIVNDIAEKVIAQLSKKELNYLKQNDEYEHFGFGLYIRNNYIYKNENLKYRVEPDDFGYKIFERVIEKIKEK